MNDREAWHAAAHVSLSPHVTEGLNDNALQMMRANGNITVGSLSSMKLVSGARKF